MLHDACGNRVTFLASTGDSGFAGRVSGLFAQRRRRGRHHPDAQRRQHLRSETGWSGSGGGQSSYESEPSYQEAVQTRGLRETPDVSFDANPNTGVAVYDSYDYGGCPWVQVGGTSVAAPCWAGLVAIADQFRAPGARLAGRMSQTLPALYSFTRPISTTSPAAATAVTRPGRATTWSPAWAARWPTRSCPIRAVSGGAAANPATTVTSWLRPAPRNMGADHLARYRYGSARATPRTATGTVTFMDGGTAIAMQRSLSWHGPVHRFLARPGRPHNYCGLRRQCNLHRQHLGRGRRTGRAVATTDIFEPPGAARSPTASRRPRRLRTSRRPNAAALNGGTVTFTDQATSATLGAAPRLPAPPPSRSNSLTACGMRAIVATYSGDGPYFTGSSARKRSRWGHQVRSPATGCKVYGGDGGQATLAQALLTPLVVAVDASGDLFIADAVIITGSAR